MVEVLEFNDWDAYDVIEFENSISWEFRLSDGAWWVPGWINEALGVKCRFWESVASLESEQHDKLNKVRKFKIVLPRQRDIFKIK